MYKIEPDNGAVLPPKADFIVKLQYLMMREGYSFERLGKAIGVSGQQIWRYARGINFPRIDKVRALCKLFNVRPEWLLRKEEA